MIRHHDSLFEGNHDPIISKEIYDQCVKRYKEQKGNTIRHRGRSMLSGLLYCKRCGARYSADGHAYNGKKYYYYVCNSRRKQVRSMITDPSCKNKSYRLHELDAMILDQIRSLSVDPDAVHQMIQSRQTDDDRKREKIITQEIAKIASQRSRFLDLYGIGQFSVDELQAKIEPLDERKKSLERELEEIQKSAGMSEYEALETISTFADVIASRDQTALRNLVTALIERIEIDGDDIDIFWRF
jgi:site-specific DNA recombinase